MDGIRGSVGRMVGRMVGWLVPGEFTKEYCDFTCAAGNAERGLQRTVCLNSDTRIPGFKKKYNDFYAGGSMKLEAGAEARRD